MSLTDLTSAVKAETVGLRQLALPLFALTIFASALLLFALEPMFTKTTLPALGGSPSVWSVAMVFFQGVMFAGYCYTHVLTRWMEPRRGAVLHVCVLAAGFLFLPVGLREGLAPPTQGDPTLWLIGVFAMSVGLPFFALSAQGPLLQAWFARSGHGRARDPYFLYGASNIGSFAALIAYPLVVEPLLGLAAQSRAWTLGYAALAGLMALCALSVFGRGGFAPEPARIAGKAAPASLTDGLSWVALAFVPSALLVSVTAHISTDIAAAPLLWVIPLGLYLLSFVMTFRAGSFAVAALSALLQPWVLAIVMMAGCVGVFSALVIGLLCHLALFFINALVCHAALYRRRPDAQDLTLFYAAMSLGGALGGLFAGLAAPWLFSSVVEYPVLAAAALFCRPGALPEIRALNSREIAKVSGGALGLPIASWLLSTSLSPDLAPPILAVGVGAAILLNWRAPGRVAILALSATLSVFLMQGMIAKRESFRSFFGVLRVEDERDGQFRTLVHGTTVHGAVRIRNLDGSPVSGKPLPATYYAPQGPLGDAIKAARGTHGRIGHAALIGLGVGALACHMRPDEPVTYFEIDPLVIQLARDAARFRYLSQCAPQAQFVAGDARLTLARQPVKSDIIVVDAFSSDAIPVHLLTREAFALYLDKLSADGLVAVHISNNHMEFSRIIARIGAELGLATYRRADLAIVSDNPEMRFPSVAVILAREPAHLGELAGADSAWKRVEPDMKSWLWTDDYSTILSAIADKWRR